MPRVLIVGSANVDFTVALPRLPRAGETVSEGTLLVARGGKGANQAVAARRLGGEVRLIACVGDDASGREVKTALAGEGIAVEAIATTSSAATGTALIVVDAEGRNQIAVAPGANRALTPADVDARAADFAWAEVVVCSLEVELGCARRAFEHARRHGALTINESEAARLTSLPVQDADSAAKAAAAIRALGAMRVIVTLGAAGALADGPEGRVHAPAPRVTAVDTTGAGDAFNGALAVALAERRSLGAALAFANTAAALACTKRGAQPSMPVRAEVERSLARSS